ncbi:hypothetical protein C9374_001614 [Naegleria lovaniensis]|uniref:Uncharacterized protein n=1 Tax=Naegleria lovaniensis TaxID=51637 RepID=A0AA88KRF2_NAELO|nr:uncharacterized protein C9374_001614 [Naegleria lovaniensis]KAG2387282.1 hypothetical protein C9374_001614 [Naegleria lovaniensis]
MKRVFKGLIRCCTRLSSLQFMHSRLLTERYFNTWQSLSRKKKIRTHEDWEKDIIHPQGFYDFGRKETTHDKIWRERNEKDLQQAMVELDKYPEEVEKISKEIEKHLKRNLGLIGDRDLTALLYLTLPFMKSFVEETLGLVDPYPIFYCLEKKEFITIIDMEEEGNVILLNSHEFEQPHLEKFEVDDPSRKMIVFTTAASCSKWMDRLLSNNRKHICIDIMWNHNDPFYERARLVVLYNGWLMLILRVPKTKGPDQKLYELIMDPKIMKFGFDAPAKAGKLSQWFESCNLKGIQDERKHFIVDADEYNWKNFRLLTFGVPLHRRVDCFLKEQPDSFYHFGNLDPNTKQGRTRLEYASHGVFTCWYFAEYMDTSEENKDIHTWATSHHPEGKTPILLEEPSDEEFEKCEKLAKKYDRVKLSLGPQLFYKPSVVNVKYKETKREDFTKLIMEWIQSKF